MGKPLTLFTAFSLDYLVICTHYKTRILQFPIPKRSSGWTSSESVSEELSDELSGYVVSWPADDTSALWIGDTTEREKLKFGEESGEPVCTGVAPWLGASLRGDSCASAPLADGSTVFLVVPGEDKNDGLIGLVLPTGQWSVIVGCK
jgi:hypothetical protein